MTYQEAIDFLFASLPVYQKIGPGAYKPGLGNSETLDAMFGHPHRRYPCIHIAGTNGKGSTAHTLAAILRSAGYRTGLYTSPHIFDFRERIRIDGAKVPEERVVEFVGEWMRRRPEGLSPSFFELTSTMAFRCFADEQVDVAVIETGLGGRLDSTNIITPVLSVITNISPDHTALLGDTLAKIAFEKAGIIKPGVPVVIGEWNRETLPVFEAKARETGSPLMLADRIGVTFTPGTNIYDSELFGRVTGELLGDHQALNAATVMKSVEVLRGQGFDIPDSAVREGFARVTELTGLFGRWTTIMEHPRTIADTGHNCGGWEKIVATLNRTPAPRKALVIGFVADKDLTPVLRHISAVTGDVRLWFAAPTAPRGLAADLLAAAARGAGLDGTVQPDVNMAVAEARAWAAADGLVLVAGSNFLISDLRVSDTKLPS